ncbi:MAG: anthranilate synthase component I [Bacillota bacterium]
MSKVKTCYPSKEEFVEFASESNLIPVCREIVADLETPVSVYNKVYQDGCSCLLESVEGSAKLSRYSFLAGDPFLQLKAFGKHVVVSGENQSEKRKGDVLNILREVLAEYKVAQVPGLPRFFGGAVGYIGYDSLRSAETVSSDLEDELGIPDTYLVFPESVIVFDHYTSKLKIIVNVLVSGDPEAAYRKAENKLDYLTKTIRCNNGYAYGDPADISSDLDAGFSLTSNTSRDQFMANVEKVKEYIDAGDILQAVISQRFETAINSKPFEVYRALRSLNPSPYMYYLNFDQVQVAGASPEMLVRLENGVVETRPIAGTRPRGENREADVALEKELFLDDKERSEHEMLVDLGCADLDRVSLEGSVEVPNHMICEKYSHVMHLVSEVRGKLKENRDAIDALVACFPAGTVSGAPREKAMEIIDQLEVAKRGPYAGAVGYFSFTGNMDTCITIRTIVFANGKAYAQAGAGIVADSKPEKEYEETINKAEALVKALQLAGEGVD